MGSAFYDVLNSKYEVFVFTRSPEKIRDKSINILSSLEEVKNVSDIIIFAIKPKDFRTSINDFKILDGKIIISMLPTVSLQELKEAFPQSNNLYRIMPNINIKVRHGILGIVEDNLKNEDKLFLENLFSDMSKIIYIKEELIDKFAIFAASTPAFVAQIIEGLILAGIESGFNVDLSREISLRVIEGTVKHIEKTKNTSEIIYRVSSPGGLTIKGVHSLEKSSIKGIIMDSISKAIDALGGRGK